MRLIRSTDYRRMPWKNGGGETAEIAVAPAAAPLDAFDWRISMARVDGDGPFSVFAGVDRTLVVLDGGGIRLAAPGSEAVELRPGAEPYSFPADLATSAVLLAGPITDFNVMTRRARLSHRVRREAVGATRRLRASAPATLIFCVDGSLRMLSSGGPLSVGPRDSLLLGPDDGEVTVEPDSPATVLLVEIVPA